MRIDVIDSGNIEDDDKHGEDEKHEESSIEFEHSFTVQSQHVQKLGMNKQTISQTM